MADWKVNHPSLPFYFLTKPALQEAHFYLLECRFVIKDSFLK